MTIEIYRFLFYHVLCSVTSFHLKKWVTILFKHSTKTEVFIKDFSADLVGFTEEILNRKLHFFAVKMKYLKRKKKHK